MADEKQPDQMCRHIAVIMDGNGRWAKQRGKIRSFGHKEGLKATKRLLHYASERGLKYLTLYAFSTENWKRAEEEVSYLMNLIHLHLRKEMKFYKKNHIRLRFIGDLSRLKPSLQEEMRSVERDTASYDGLTVQLAINYGGRDELRRAVQKLIDSGKQEITEADIEAELDTAGIPDPDLIIRTAGEQRLSNFLMWQSAYSEFWYIAIPILLVILLFPLPFNAAVNAVIMAFTALAGIETARLTETRLTRLNKAAAAFCAVLPPLSVFCFLFLPDTVAALTVAAILILAPTLLIGREAFSRSAEKWNNSLGRIAGYAFILLYIGGLSAALVGFQFLSRFVPDDNPGLIYLIYLLMIFTNDTAAYFTGVAVGRFTPHPAPISPKKSLAGFIGGAVGCLAVSAAAFFILPQLFENSILWALTVGAVLAFAGIVGDLVESAFKRSAGVKDSGRLMGGRGGVLDSIDSVLYGAPFFFVLLSGIHLI